MSGRFSFFGGGAHLYIQHHRIFPVAVLRLAWFYLTAELHRGIFLCETLRRSLRNSAVKQTHSIKCAGKGKCRV